MKFLIVGCGSIGMRHIRNLKALGIEEITAFRTSCEDIEAFEADEGIKVYVDYESALDDNPDAVIISNPTSLHVEYATKAANRGLDLFIEKPLSNSLEGVDKLIKEVEINRVKALIGCNMRFDKHLMRIKELIRTHAIGQVYFASIYAGGYLPDWRPSTDYKKSYSAIEGLGGGVILDLIHEIDYSLWFFGSVRKIDARAHKLSNLEIETEDFADILLEFEDGPIAVIRLDYLNRLKSRGCEIVGESGTIRWDYNEALLELFDTSHGKVEFIIDNYDRNDMYVEMMEHFIRCVEGNEEPRINILDGKYSLEIALQAKKIGAMEGSR